MQPVRSTMIGLQLERSELVEMADAIRDFAALELQQTFQPKLFHGETSENGSVDHREAQRIRVDFSGAGEIAHESAGKAIARAGGIVNFVQRICGNAETRNRREPSWRHVRRA